MNVLTYITIVMSMVFYYPVINIFFTKFQVKHKLCWSANQPYVTLVDFRYYV